MPASYGHFAADCYDGPRRRHRFAIAASCILFTGTLPLTMLCA